MILPLLWTQWIGFSLSVGVYGLLVLLPTLPIPDEVRRFYKYGKSVNMHQKSLLAVLDLPKSWFSHFYLFSTVYFTYLFYSVATVYSGNPIPNLTAQLLDTFCGFNRLGRISPETTLICMTLALIQVYRRLYECLFVSIYSNTSSINIVHYVIAIVYYFGVGLSVIAESIGFQRNYASILPNSFSWTKLFAVHHLIGIILFILASRLQYKTHLALANLRKDDKGQIVSYSHKIPTGGMFTFISSPHYLAEILIYLALNIVLAGQSVTWWLLCCFVLVNQILMGLVNHQWYKKQFPSYPTSRRAVIPFVL